MPSFPSPFGSDDSDLFDGYDEFASNHLPRPGEFLESHHLLTGADHVAFHRLTRDCFEERKVYDMTFNYNLARLNLDTATRAPATATPMNVTTRSTPSNRKTSTAYSVRSSRRRPHSVRRPIR